MKLPALVAIALFTAFATTLGLADAQTPGTQMAPDCAYGAYQSPSGDLIAIQPMPGNQGPKYTLLDGRRGYTRAADSPAHCANGVFVGNSASGKRFVWHRLRFRATPANFMSLGTKLHGLLLEPAGVKKPPLIVFVHGSEKYSPIRLYYQLLFTAQGVATFFYDKRGTGESQGTYTQDFSVLATDAANAARTARKIDAGRFSRLGFFGGSQGGWVAPLAALQVHADFLEVGFGCVCTPLEQDQWQVDYQLVHEDGFTPSILPQVHDVTAVTAQVMGSRSPQFGLLGKLKTKYGAAPWFSRIDGQYSGEMLHEDGRKPWLVGVRLGHSVALFGIEHVAPPHHTAVVGLCAE